MAAAVAITGSWLLRALAKVPPKKTLEVVSIVLTVVTVAVLPAEPIRIESLSIRVPESEEVLGSRTVASKGIHPAPAACAPSSWPLKERRLLERVSETEGRLAAPIFLGEKK